MVVHDIASGVDQPNEAIWRVSELGTTNQLNFSSKYVNAYESLLSITKESLDQITLMKGYW